MAKRFEKTVKTVKKTSRNLAKVALSLVATWHIKPHLITVSGDLKP